MPGIKLRGPANVRQKNSTFPSGVTLSLVNIAIKAIHIHTRETYPVFSRLMTNTSGNVIASGTTHSSRREHSATKGYFARHAK